MTAIESVSDGVERLSLRTPTLLPATETNTYFVARGRDFYVVEPATPYLEEQALLIDAIREKIHRGFRLRGVIVTHHHGDHIGAATAVSEAFGVGVSAHRETQRRLLDRVKIEHTLDDGDALFDGEVTALHTPGHARGHLCLRERNGAWLIAGDMVASVGTILIDVDDGGDMREYLRQLERLAECGPGVVLPAHGAPIEEGASRLRYYVQHRLAREAKIANTLEKSWQKIDTIVARAYDDTPSSVWPIAARSALAHLDKLRHEGRAVCDGDRWRSA